MTRTILHIVIGILLIGYSYGQNYIMTNGATITTCSGTFLDPGGTSNYQGVSSAQTTTYTICNPTPGDPMYIQFNSFNLYYNNCIWGSATDRLRIYSGTSISGTLLGTFSQTTIPGLITVYTCVTFQFTREPGGGWLCSTNNGAPGWSATLSCTPPGCTTASPFCSDQNYNFPNGTGTSAPSGVNYGCLYSQPNPVWYYMQIGNSGSIQLGLSQTTGAGGTGSLIDVDFAMWGPFTSVAQGCDLIFETYLAPLQCSFSPAGTETVGLGYSGGVSPGSSIPANAVTGQFYILLLTNYSNQSGYINLSQTNGTGSTDCTIVPLGLDMLNLKVAQIGGRNRINWSLLANAAISYFEVQRSTDGEHWREVGTIPNSQMNLQEETFEYWDSNFEPTVNYYRIKKVMVGGHSEYSTVVMVNNELNSVKWIKVVNSLGQEVDPSFEGIKIYIYEDGSTLKSY